jgi:IS4 transposase
MFDWARFRRTKGAIKLHLLLDHEGYLPEFAWITEGKLADVKVAQQLYFAPGTIVIDDRGYTDYALWGRWCSQQVYFVTRMKDNALYEVIGDKRIPHHRHILKDEQIELRGPKAIEKCPCPLRRIEAEDPETGEILVFITNHIDLGASTIAAIYKDRWQIESFFKALKQNLKIKTFVGTSPNAVKIQIWTALIAMLILKFLQLRSKFHWSLSNLVALLRMNLFTHRDLWAWLNKPFDIPPVPYEPEQLKLNLA